MNEEEKGFVIKDKRTFDEKGELKDEGPRQEAGQKEEPVEEKQKERTETPPLPEVSFTSLIFSLSSSAFFHLGEVADPETGERKKDLPLAKNAIDTINLLNEKTKGNLTEEEQKFIDTVLSDLKWRYVKAVG